MYAMLITMVIARKHASTFFQPALTCYETQDQYIEDRYYTVARRYEHSSCENNILRTTNVPAV